MSQTTCPSCGDTQVRVLGAIPPSTMFAGRTTEVTRARLAICRSCGLGFRDPQPSPESLARLYAAGSSDAWQETPGRRRDWQLALGIVEASGAQSVLDVGCFDGGFLALVPDRVERVGIEINPAAAERARQRGIRIAASDLAQLSSMAETFDCVTAFDVIEHVADPAQFLAMLTSVTRPGGRIIIATGNLDAPSWRVMGSRYLYCWFQEHIAFISPRWIRRSGPRLGLEVVDIVRFTHMPAGLSGKLAGFAKSVVYRLAPGSVDRLRAAGSGSSQIAAAPPAWTGAKDHVLIELRRASV